MERLMKARRKSLMETQMKTIMEETLLLMETMMVLNFLIVKFLMTAQMENVLLKTSKACIKSLVDTLAENQINNLM